MIFLFGQQTSIRDLIGDWTACCLHNHNACCLRIFRDLFFEHGPISQKSQDFDHSGCEREGLVILSKSHQSDLFSCFNLFIFPCICRSGTRRFSEWHYIQHEKTHMLYPAKSFETNIMVSLDYVSYSFQLQMKSIAPLKNSGVPTTTTQIIPNVFECSSLLFLLFFSVSSISFFLWQDQSLNHFPKSLLLTSCGLSNSTLQYDLSIHSLYNPQR